MTVKNILHVGCGPQNIRSMPAFFQDGMWDEIRFDIDPRVQPDIVGELQDLSLIEDGAMDAVYSSHNIEHVTSFEVRGVLAGFLRVLKADGFALILCPDIQSVAQAMAAGVLEEPLYQSPAGPINALDIVYGHQQAIQRGELYMAHKTAFTAQTLARHLLAVGFGRVDVVRDRIYGMHAAAFVNQEHAIADAVVAAVLPGPAQQVESLRFMAGC